MICLIYMDNCLFFAHDASKINTMITNLKQDFVLEPKDDVTAFLGIELRKCENNELKLVQPHLINQVIEIVFGTKDCNATDTPTSSQSLHMDTEPNVVKNGSMHLYWACWCIWVQICTQTLP